MKYFKKKNDNYKVLDLLKYIYAKLNLCMQYYNGLKIVCKKFSVIGLDNKTKNQKLKSKNTPEKDNKGG